MKICLVTAFPPSRGGLSEYGFHIARELQQTPFLSLLVLADELPSAQPELDGFSVLRCWSFDDFRSPGRLLNAIRQFEPDVVWFNLLFTTFGRNPLAAFSGLATPVLTRLCGYYTHVTLHHLMDTVDLNDAGVRLPRLYRAAGAIATKMLLLSNSVTVLMPTYREILRQQYGPANVRVRAHGILSSHAEFPDFSVRGNPVHRILAFGKWGTYKRLELMLEAFDLVVKQVPNAKLVVAGGDHPRTPGYVTSLARRFENNSRIEFTGYVPEQAIPDLFRTASVAVMPYSSSTGASGVAHLACAYGVPIISADIPDFRRMADDEGLAIDFYQPGNIENLADHLIALLGSPERQQDMAKQNFCAGLRMTMPTVIHQYIHHFGMEQRTKALKSMMRLRKLSRWLPSNYLAAWAMSRNRFHWSDRPASTYVPFNGNGNGAHLEDRRTQLRPLGAEENMPDLQAPPLTEASEANRNGTSDDGGSI
jgi:glycosyltransferase involved in cell wall biosynthesis